ncbi:MAG: hypothetical protein CM1200mP10_33470 [Candidatus Neomarinimicrobiota bacterium]|nr:MAG: hypothetical protein CM1200mP10_33470 [Candidatus Neomarinimicrobiota bacterium]
MAAVSTKFNVAGGNLTTAYFFLPFFKRNNIISAYEYLEDRFGPSVRVYGAVTFFFGQLVRISLILYLLSLMVNEVTNLSVIQSILLAGLVVGLYTIIGGIEAVIWTDVIQTFTLLSGGVICLGVIIHQLPGGLSQIMDVAIANNKLTFSELKNGVLRPVPWGISLANKTGIMMLLLGLSWFFQEYVTNQNMIQRYAAVKNVQEARKQCTYLRSTYQYGRSSCSLVLLFTYSFKCFQHRSSRNAGWYKKAEDIFPILS